jgi:hypothetical protein
MKEVRTQIEVTQVLNVPHRKSSTEWEQEQEQQER